MTITVNPADMTVSWKKNGVTLDDYNEIASPEKLASRYAKEQEEERANEPSNIMRNGTLVVLEFSHSTSKKVLNDMAKRGDTYDLVEPAILVLRGAGVALVQFGEYDDFY